jgi:hypothetical protein
MSGAIVKAQLGGWARDGAVACRLAVLAAPRHGRPPAGRNALHEIDEMSCRGAIAAGRWNARGGAGPPAHTYQVATYGSVNWGVWIHEIFLTHSFLV